MDSWINYLAENQLTPSVFSNQGSLSPLFRFPFFPSAGNPHFCGPSFLPMKKHLLLAFGLGLTVSALEAQKKKLSLEESMTNPAFAMAIRQPHGFADGSWGEVVSSSKGDALVRRKGPKTDTLLFASAWKADRKNFPMLNWKSEKILYGLLGSELSQYQLDTKTATSLGSFPEEAENQDIEPNTLVAAYTKGNNLYLLRNKQEVEITREPNKDIVHGQSVHRNEYGINKGTYWSPSGSHLAFYRMDQSMVTDYPIVDINTKPAKVRNIKYPMAGQTSHEVSVGIYDLATNKTLYLQVDGPKDQYLTGLTWTPDGKYLSITVLNRETNHLKLNVYDISTGKWVKTLLEERSDKYLDPQEGPLFLKNLDFVWQSEITGVRQLHLYSWEGKQKSMLSQGPEKVTDVLGLDASGKNLLYIQTGGLAMDRMLKSVDLATAKVTSLSQTKGVHNLFWCDGNKKLLDVWSNLGTPKKLDLIDLATKTTSNLKTFSNPFAEYEFPTIDTLSLKSLDGQVLHARMIKPADFSPNKQYPVIVYVYGGPHAQMVTDSWLAGANTWMAAWANEGFIVFTLDNRGSYNRSVAFEQAHHRKLGDPELQDQLVGLQYLKSLSYVDGNRIGVHGWSYGGFMTTNLMSKSPYFKAGIAGAPVIDWNLYEIMYTERYMDTPKENPQGYENSNLTNFAKDLKGRLMLIHGTADDVVVWQNTQAYLDKAIKAGVQLDYFIYPGHGHSVGGRDRMHLMKKMLQFFKEEL